MLALIPALILSGCGSSKAAEEAGAVDGLVIQVSELTAEPAFIDWEQDGIAMQLYALSSGNWWMGALSMFCFCLGTIPLMLGIGLVGGSLNKRFAQPMRELQQRNLHSGIRSERAPEVRGQRDPLYAGEERRDSLHLLDGHDSKHDLR